MSKTCYNCGTENGDVETFCRTCGAALTQSQLQHAGIQAGTPEERVLWANGEIQLTTHAVLIGMDTDAPDVVPLETIYDVVVEERCVVLKVKEGDDQYCMLENPDELAALVKEQMFRPRLAHERTTRATSRPTEPAAPALAPGAPGRAATSTPAGQPSASTSIGPGASTW